MKRYIVYLKSAIVTTGYIEVEAVNKREAQRIAREAAAENEDDLCGRDETGSRFAVVDMTPADAS